MSTAYEIYVISNANLFREGLNAIAEFCYSDGFKSATYIGALIGIVTTAIAYVKQHDVMLFLKWLVMYFFVFNILLGITQTVVVINTSDQSETPAVIDNVPLGIALPAHIITAIGYDFGNDLEEAFNTPGALQYNKTGMMFGSNLFRLSLASNLDDADTMNEMNAYVKSCVVGDILINHKYSINDLLTSTDIWALMSRNPSPIRGIFVGKTFYTCQEATTDLNSKINNYATNIAPGILSKFIPSHKIYALTAVNNLLQDSYQGLLHQSNSATQILKQNISINAFRSGIINYAAETNSVAGMQNYANTVAMQNTRMSWATSSNIGVETLPLMQVVLLLLMLCIFPLIAVLTLIPTVGIGVFMNYIYTLLWLESWPLMFTILNMAMNYYLAPGIGAPAGTVTLSNINLLAQEHSDIASVAGYLILAVPFLSIGLVKGMASTFTQASQYLGGMLHSIAQSAASSVAMGNYSLGNVSTANATSNSLSANKYDTNFSNMHGLATDQLGNGATVTSTPSGQTLTNTGTGTSHLTTGINVNASLSTALSHSADKYKAAAMSSKESLDNSLSSAATNALSYDESTSKGQSLSDTSTIGVNSNFEHAMSRMNSLAHEVMSREGTTFTDAYKKLAQAGVYEKAGFDSKGTALGKAAETFGLSGSVGADAMQQAQSSSDQSYHSGVDHSISQREAQEFRESMSVVENYSQSHAASDSSNSSSSLASRVGADFRKASSIAHSISADLSAGERLSQQASYVANKGTSVQSDFTQVMNNHIRQFDPANANRILTDQSASGVMLRQSIAENLMHQYANNLEKNIVSQSSNINPEESYREAVNKIHQSSGSIETNFANNSQALKSEAASAGVNFNKAQFQDTKNAVNAHQNNIQNKVKSDGDNITSSVRNGSVAAEKIISKEKSADQAGLTAHGINFAGSAVEWVEKKI